ncbi:hypothetical protein ACJIZ3_003426 [Penstemon smallii]|uniref:Importin N-terminal domain-containing protein n=1 Tax=Penstemon smallii TaxID=265156 RepID=A0ABD3UBW5_9LAMI
MAAEKLRDLSQPMDVALLDATVDAFYGTGSKEERTAADHILRDLKNNSDMWLQVVHILSHTQNLKTKYFALQVLEDVIKYRWNALPVEQRDGMKNYTSEVIIKLSSDDISLRRERLYVNKLNIILVQILKHEWPARWRSFIPNLVAAARTSEAICENCMAILKLLSEEIFDFSRGEMTQVKVKELKQSLNSEFQLIHELCLYVLSASQRAELIRATLATLHAFLSWIPLGYMLESQLVQTLLNFFSMPAYRNLTLQCLTKVAARSFRDFYKMQYIKIYTIFMVQLQTILAPTSNFLEFYSNGNTEEQAFIQNLALFFTSFYKSHIRVLESYQENINALFMGLEYLINISYVNDTEVFKVCLDYWNFLVSELVMAKVTLYNPPATVRRMALQRCQLYAGPMSKLRLLMICRMAKPEEVLIVEDENGNIVRETMKDNDMLVQYKIMRETLIYLARLDYQDTENEMLKKLSKQLNGEDWTWNNLNTVCWAIGSISESMVDKQEKRFFVMVIRYLFKLSKIAKGRDEKAVIACNIMYVVGQYTSILRAHSRLLKTIVKRLFEFMQVTHPGVKDMACNTFLKIVQKCKHKFVIVKVRKNEPFVSQLLTTLRTTIKDLEPHQIHSFYESVGNMIQVESDPHKRDEYLQILMELPNQKWAEIIGQARQSVDYLKDPDVIRAVLNILQANTSAATSLGTYFLPQITLIFLDMLNVYSMYSELISTSIAQGGPYASRTSHVKLLRSVKRVTLKLIETFLDKAEDQPHIGERFVRPMMDPVLGDYARNVPEARESEVLSLFATIINKYKKSMIKDVPRIFEAVFACTLEMIRKNFEDYPEHRLKFLSLLQAMATHCFHALINLSSKQIMDFVIWAFRHTERDIAEAGLNLLLEMLKKFRDSMFCNQFYKTYFLTIEQEIFAVLTDTFHKSGFKLHVLVLQHLFCLVESSGVTVPLWDITTAAYPYPSNSMFVREYTINLLSTSFPNMTAAEVTQFVAGLFESRADYFSFKNHIRDFLVQSKEFSAHDNKDLYAEEADAQREREQQHMLSIPGLIAPNETEDEMVES